MLVLGSVSILLTVLILGLYHKAGKPNDPSCILSFTRIAAKVIRWNFPPPTGKDVSRVSPLGPDNVDDKTHKNKTDARSVSSVEDDIEVTWQLVALVLDAFCFYVFFVINLLMNIIFVVILAAGDTSDVNH